MKLTLLLTLFTLTQCKLTYNVDPNGISVSGLSSGAYMAVQYQVAFSSTVRGAAVFAGGPFYCAQDQMTNAFIYCMSSLSPDVSSLVSLTQQFAQSGDIDPLNNLEGQAVYLFSGSSDYTVKTAVVQALAKYYGALGLNNITTQFSLSAGHGWPTLDYGVPCSMTESPYLTNCNYDGAGAALSALYGRLSPKGNANPNNIVPLDQSNFTSGNPSSIFMGPTAYLYVPTACSQTTTVCKLHVSFHGCQQDVSNIGNVFYTETGLNDWAESNNILVLYPQAISGELTNPEGCWDWWGYTNSNYAFKSGPQMAAVKNIVDYLLGNRV